MVKCNCTVTGCQRRLSCKRWSSRISVLRGKCWRSCDTYGGFILHGFTIASDHASLLPATFNTSATLSYWLTQIHPLYLVTFTAVEFMENPLFSPIYIRSWFLEPDDEIGAVGRDDLWICLFSALSPASLSPCLCHLHVLDWLHLLLNFVSSFRVKSYSMSDTVVHIWSVCKRSFPFASHFMQQRILFRCHSWKRYSFSWLGLLCKFLDGGRFCNLPCLEGYERKSLWCVVKYLCDSDHSSGLRQKGWRSHHATEWWNCGSQHDKQ